MRQLDMSWRMTLATVLMIGSILSAPGSSQARVVRFVVAQARTFAGGTSFGDVGTYQRLDGTAYMEVNPSDPLNAGVVYFLSSFQHGGNNPPPAFPAPAGICLLQEDADRFIGAAAASGVLR